MTRNEITPAQTRERAHAAVRSRLRDWLTDPVAAQADVLNIALKPPTERRLATQSESARDWVRLWHEYHGPGAVDWEPRRWPSFGTQNVPVRLRLSGADQICRAAEQATRWRRLLSRREKLVALGRSDGLPGAVAATFPRWETLDDDDFIRLIATTDWLLKNPRSGLLIRQLPIEGVDTKWLRAHRRLVENLVDGARGSTDLGIGNLPSLREIVLLDPALLPGMPKVLASTVAGLAELPITPSTVLILENREGVHALPPIPGTVAIAGGGNAVTDLTAIEWVRHADIVYWGDLDTHGVVILDRLRRRLPQVRSLLMDPATFTRFRHLCVPEPAPATEDPSTLTDTEFAALLAIRASGLRLEQERIPWPYVLQQLAAAGLPVVHSDGSDLIAGN
ncbi:hypothetical protein GOHSU_12_00340 [Gordonia hirsuta DSM 44140 = NBRC 16056]|uniref:Wadjet protein JetD C-terminal domain-containing protein n=1 Tax=Gordonia hirsuta DSM 44140 = NBRC 16056 TaxID=1121927 RepID=L7L6U5_9ACTN|nr:Wadjet anti-phage system protein JetD domain-containing protein [Gordonia hirsuta]GAC56644.1 hypothetical protein GOHSU_12_00340 [Gordonia hirsuta DSM 44140 = NBRC 16056]